MNAGLDSTPWILLGVLVIPIWVLGGRLAAEIPGTKTGKMLLWWCLFVVFHVWGFLAYYAYEKLAAGYVFRDRFARKVRYGDRDETDILASPFGPVGSKMTGPIELTGLPGVCAQYMSPLSRETDLTA